MNARVPPGSPYWNLAKLYRPSVVIGLALVFVSPYFLVHLTLLGIYLLPSSHLVQLIVLPSLLAVLTLTTVAYVLIHLFRRFGSPPVVTAALVSFLALLSLIAIKSLAYSSGHDWRDAFPANKYPVYSLRLVKLGAFIILALLIYCSRLVIHRWVRLLSSLGFAFAVLAAFRILMWGGSMTDVRDFKGNADSRISAGEGGSPANIDRDRKIKNRRVIWVIFDETDLGRAFGPASGEQPNLPPLPNLKLLSKVAVFATNANSPADATIYSIPALLTGRALSGQGVQVTKSGSLMIEDAAGALVGYDEDHTIFSAISALGRRSSVLGFYHPYCRQFLLARCDSFAWPAAGQWDAALLENLPDSLSSKPDWDRITSESIRLLPEYLARDDALTFIHLNFPHPPADFADRVLKMPASKNPLVEYSHNLQLADQVLGKIMRILEARASLRETLLVVSTDHWLRNRWYQPNKREMSRPIPLIVWKVGDSLGYVITKPVSTVHSREMILNYLNANIGSQAEIADWWDHQTFERTFIGTTPRPGSVN